METLVSGTFDNTSPTAITLSGSAIVSSSAVRQTINGAYTSGWVRSTTAEWNIPDNITELWTALFVANQLDVFPSVLNARHTVSKLVFEVNTADAATTHLRCGIYGNGSDGRPDGLIYDSGDLSSVAASTGLKIHTLSTPLELDAGHYWFGMVSDSTTLNISGIPFSAIVGGNGGISRFSNERRRHPYNSSVTGALPSTFSVSQNSTDTRPCFGWQ